MGLLCALLKIEPYLETYTCGHMFLPYEYYFVTSMSTKRKWGQTKKVQVGKDQEKAQSEKDSHSKNRGGKKPN